MNHRYQHYQTQICSHRPEKQSMHITISLVKETNVEHMPINQNTTGRFKLIDRTLSGSFKRFNNGCVGLLPSNLLNLSPEAHGRINYIITIKHICNVHEINLSCFLNHHA
jgi:hypothetical protein